MIPKFGFKTVFSKLFFSVMLTLILFAVAMIALTHLVHDNSANTRWQVLSKQIINQIDPFIDELDNSITKNERLQARFMLAVIKKSLDIFDESLNAKLGLYDREGHLLIQTDDSDLPKTLPEDPSWLARMIPFLSSSQPTNVQAVGDRGYTLIYEPRNPPTRSEIWAMLNLFTGTILLLILMTVVLWWIARSMTWRINKMSAQMTHLGEGDFSVRVPAKGNDEIAHLAHGFNQAAEKIEQLINANNLLLAHASHEIRTPITRIRLQVEMMDMLAKELPDSPKKMFKKRADAINRDLTGLNDLVESILLVSRLDAGHVAQKNERLDLYPLINNECQYYPEAKFYGQSTIIDGQPKLLIHLVRNLLNNAMLHGVPPVEVYLYGVINKADAFRIPKELLEQQHANELGLVADNVDAAKSSKNLSAQVGKQNKDNQNNKPDVQLDEEDKTASDDLQQADTLQANNNANIRKVAETVTKTFTDNGLDDDKSDQNNIIDNSIITDDTSKFKSRWGNKKAENQKVTKANKKQNIDKPNKGNETGFAMRLRRNKQTPYIPPNFAVLAIIDQGHGIPINKREEIFSPFVRLQQKNKGSGLGLSLVAQIAEAHNGRISTDTYNGHTRFLVILPTSANSNVNLNLEDGAIN